MAVAACQSEAPKPAIQGGETKSLAQKLNSQGDSAIDLGNYPGAVALFQQSMDAALAGADSFAYYDSKLDLACVYDRLGELDKSISIGHDVLHAYIRSEDSSRVGRAYTTLSAFYGRAGKLPEQIETAQKGFDIVKKHGDDIHRFAAYNQMAFTFSDAGHWDKALPLLDTALLLLKSSGVMDQLAGIYLNLGDCHRHLGNFTQATDYLQKSIVEATSYNQPHIRARDMFRLSQIAEAQARPAEALDLFKKWTTLRDSVISAERNESVRDLEIKYQTKEKEQEIQLLQANQRVETQRRNLMILLFGVVLVGGLLLLQYWRAQANAAQQELERSRQELHDFSQLLLVKNTRIAELEHIDQPEEPVVVQEEEDPEEPEGSSGEYAQELYRLQILTDQDWAVFKQLFERSYPGFLARLRLTYPEMSNAEERLFVLLKLNYNRQELSAILGVSDSTVKKGRIRLRKRLGLVSEQNLEQFVQLF